MIGEMEKVVKKRSMHSPLKERTAHRLKGGLKKGMQKVASEPGCGNGWHGMVYVPMQ